MVQRPPAAALLDEGVRPMLQRFTAEQSLLSALTAERRRHDGGGADLAGANPTARERASAAALRQSKLVTDCGGSKADPADAAIAEVRALTVQHGSIHRASGMRAQPSAEPLACVRSMHRARAARHASAVESYRAGATAAAERAAASTRAAVAAFDARLVESNAEIETELAATTSDKALIVLEAEGVMRIWEDVAAQFPRRSEWIAALEAELADAEAERRAGLEAALAFMLRELMDIAHVAAGEVERIVEVGAHEANLAILANRRSHTELTRRLFVREVTFEKDCRERWEAGAMHWRQLRTDQEISRFKEYMDSEAVVDPPSVAELFEDLTARQVAAHNAMVGHVSAARLLLPPHCTKEGVVAWMHGAHAIRQDWLRTRERALLRLSEAAAIVDLECKGAYAALAQDVAHFAGDGGLASEEARERLERECLALVTQRRGASEALHSDVAAYLDHCARGDDKLMAALGAFLSAVAQRIEGHVITTQTRRAKADAALLQCREAADSADDANETAFAHACAELRQGPTEAVLDRKVEEALSALNTIQDGYRAFHRESLGIIQAYPLDARDDDNAHEVAVCAMLGLLHNCEPPRPGPTAAPADDQVGAETTAGEAGVAAGGCHGVEEDEEGAAAEEVGPGPLVDLSLPPVITSRGTRFACVKSLYDTVFADLIAPKSSDRAGDDVKGVAEGKGGAKEVEGADSTVAYGTEGEAVEAVEAATDPTAGTTVEEVGGESGPPSNSSTGPAAARHAPSLPQRALSGKPCVAAIAIPAQPMREVLEAVRSSTLDHLERVSSANEAAVLVWEKSKSEASTDELDQRLRDHRPRAGIVEEDLRAGRFAELVAQQRTFERYMRRAGRETTRREEAYAQQVTSARETLAAALKKLAALEPSLSSMSSSASLDIKRRECAAQKDVIAAMAKRMAGDLKAKADAKRQALEDASARFAEEHLKPTDVEEPMGRARSATAKTTANAGAGDGLQATKEDRAGMSSDGALRKDGSNVVDAGASDGSSAQATRSAMSSATTHLGNAPGAEPVLACGAWSPDTVAACEARLSAMIAEAARVTEQQATEAAALEEANVARAEELAASLEAAVGPHREDLLLIESLDHILNRARSEVRHAFEASDAAAAEISSAARRAASLCSSGGRWCDILRLLRRLASLLLARAKSLACLKSGNFAFTEVDLEQLDAREGAEGTAGMEGDTDAEGGQRHANAADVMTVRTVVEAVCEEARTALSAAAAAYYDKRDKQEPRAPTRPQRIPDSLEAMTNVLDRELNVLSRSCAAHVAAAAAELRGEVITVSKGLVRVPAAVFSDLTTGARAHGSKALGPLREQFEAEHARHEQMQNNHRDSLRPGLSDPSRESELKALCAREVERAHMSVDAVVAYANASIKEVARAASRYRARLMSITKAMAALFDNLLMPDDLVESTSLGVGAGADSEGGRAGVSGGAGADTGEAGDDAVGSRGAMGGAGGDHLRRKNLRELWRERDAKRREGEVKLVQHEARPFHLRTWEPPDKDVLTLEAAGWIDLHSLAPGAQKSQSADADCATAGVDGKVGTADAADAEGEAESEGEDEAPVVGLDIAANHCLMLARNNALEQYKEHVYEAVRQQKEEAIRLLNSESRWQTSWEKMVHAVRH